MKTKYLTLRAELVEAGEQYCDKCIFGKKINEGNLRSWWISCGIQNHPKFNEEYCANGYWKEIDLTK